MNRRDALCGVISPGGAIGGPGRVSGSRGYRRIWIMTRETHALVKGANLARGTRLVRHQSGDGIRQRAFIPFV